MSSARSRSAAGGICRRRAGKLSDWSQSAVRALTRLRSTQTETELAEYKQQAKLIFRRLTATAEPKCSIESGKCTLQSVFRAQRNVYGHADVEVDSYLVSNGIVYLTIAEKSYPRKLAFSYLDELSKEFERSYSGQFWPRSSYIARTELSFSMVHVIQTRLSSRNCGRMHSSSLIPSFSAQSAYIRILGRFPSTHEVCLKPGLTMRIIKDDGECKEQWDGQAE